MTTSTNADLLKTPVQESGKLTNSFLFKVLTIGALITLLLIPLFMIDGLISERKQREAEAKQGIALGWAPGLYVTGPMLVVPYRAVVKEVNEYGAERKVVTRGVTNYIYLYPSQLKVTADSKVSERFRGIFKANLFTSKMSFKGSFGRLDVSKYNIPANDIDWENAFIVVDAPNGKSITGEPLLTFGGKELRFQSRWQESYMDGYHLRADIQNAKGLQFGELHPFSFELNTRGTEELYVAPAANDFAFSLDSNWKTPSFQGAALPYDHKINAKGFHADWSDSLQSHNVNLQGIYYERLPSVQFRDDSFGVNFFDSVDRYQQAERTIKYGMLFVLLTFLSFFLFEIKTKLHLHPFQYLLIGSANCMFYLLLLSLSEHIAFSWSYLAASLSVVLLIGAYAKAILGQFLRGTILAGVMSTFYLVMYFILLEQEYALLFGSVALFVCLAVVMYLTRNIDWYKMRSDVNSTQVPAV